MDELPQHPLIHRSFENHTPHQSLFPVGQKVFVTREPSCGIPESLSIEEEVMSDYFKIKALLPFHQNVNGLDTLLDKIVKRHILVTIDLKEFDQQLKSVDQSVS
jgi:hypothetical protein